MATVLKTADEIDKMRIAGRLAAAVLEMIEPYVVAGVTTAELNDRCHDYIVNIQQAIPAPLNYRGFPKSICTSVNHVVCHGIPTDKKLKNGDIINIDVTVIKDEFHGDTSKMFLVGAKPSIAGKRLCELTQDALYIGIEKAKPGNTIGDIGAAIEAFANKHQLGVVREYCGHGIGRVFHEDPQILHYGTAGEGEVLVPGMTFTIEPMLNLGKGATRQLPDGWTVVTKDHSLSAQWEHTLAITDTGCEVLTRRIEEAALFGKVIEC